MEILEQSMNSDKFLADLLHNCTADTIDSQDPPTSSNRTSERYVTFSPEPPRARRPSDGSLDWRQTVDYSVSKLQADAYVLKENQAEMEERILRLEVTKKTLKKTLKKPSSTRETTVTSVPCHNRFEVLTISDDDDTNDDEDGPNPSTAWQTVPPKKRARNRRRRRDRIRVSIVGSSIVRGLGNLVTSDDIAACCYTNPGCATDHIQDRLVQMTRRPDDEV